ncbi:Dihydrodipicolinate synthetase family protein [Brevibacterium sp. 239c]|nr:Dihydrodipicolinate synthetase family protein [Brevibacterium sp. 239c]
MPITFTGIFAACITPFTSDGAEVDLDGISAQVEHMISNGVHGLVPGGSTGEFTSLTVAERKAGNRAYIQAANGRVPVVAGTGALSTAETIELSRDAEEAGADALMIVPPFYDTPSFTPHSQTVRPILKRQGRPGLTGLCAATGWRRGARCATPHLPTRRRACAAACPVARIAPDGTGNRSGQAPTYCRCE